jgi:hypothetical protein
MCRVRWIAKPDDRVLLVELIKFRREIATMIIKEEKAIRPNRPTSYIFVEDLRQLFILELIVRPVILAKVNNLIG